MICKFRSNIFTQVTNLNALGLNFGAPLLRLDNVQSIFVRILYIHFVHIYLQLTNCKNNNRETHLDKKSSNVLHPYFPILDHGGILN